MRHTILLSITVLAASLMPAAQAFADDDHASVHLEVQGEDRHSLSLTVGGWAADIVRAALPTTVHCRGDRDENVITVLRFLDRHGDGTRYTMWDDGQEFTGVRTGGRFELTVSGRPHWRHGRAHIEAPWGLAQCMLGGTVEVRDLIDAGATGLDLLVAGDEGRVHITIQ